MNTLTHAAEPWERAGCRAGTDAYGIIAETYGPTPAENMRRIVACVNACAGIPTEELEGRGFAPADDEAPLYELVSAIARVPAEQAVSRLLLLRGEFDCDGVYRPYTDEHTGG